MRGTTGNWFTTPNQDGEETRFNVQSHLSAQTVFAKAVGFGAAAQPRTKAGAETETKFIGKEKGLLRLFNFMGITPLDAAEPEGRIDCSARAV